MMFCCVRVCLCYYWLKIELFMSQLFFIFVNYASIYICMCIYAISPTPLQHNIFIHFYARRRRGGAAAAYHIILLKAAMCAVRAVCLTYNIVIVIIDYIVSCVGGGGGFVMWMCGVMFYIMYVKHVYTLVITICRFPRTSNRKKCAV